MCGRFSSTSSSAALAAAFRVDQVLVDEGLPERFNVAPTDRVYAVTERISDTAGPVRTLEVLRWGLVPSWAKDPSAGARMINARAESITTKPAFRSAFATRRAVIPLDAFYEWQPRVVPGLRKARKQPWAIRRRDGSPMSAAGLWEAWRDQSNPTGWLLSCTIVTTGPNELMRPIHDRMPVLLADGAVDRWLDPTTDSEELLALLVPSPASDLEAWPVSTAVNRAGNEGPHLLAPADLGADLVEDPIRFEEEIGGGCAEPRRANGRGGSVTP